MSDLRELRPYLDRLVDQVVEGADATRTRVDSRRVHRRWQLVVAAVVTAVALVAAVLTIRATTTSDQSVHVPAQQPRPRPQVSLLPTTTTTLNTVVSTAPPAPSIGPLDAFRLGYEGLGPIKLGMTLTEASRASGADIELIGPGSPCGEAHGAVTAVVVGHYDREGSQIWFAVRDGVIVAVRTKNPSISTISGIGVGSTSTRVQDTYPNDEPARGMHGNAVLRVTGPQGQIINFYFDADPGSVSPDTSVTFVELLTSLDLVDYGMC